MPSVVRRIAAAVTSTAQAAYVQLATAVQDLIRMRPFGGTAIPTNDGNYTAETAEVRQRYREMLRSPWVKVALLAKVWDVASDTLGMEPDDPDSERDRMIAEAATANVSKCKGGVLAVVEAILFGALIDGYGVAHKLWWDCDRGRWAGYRMLYELRAKDSDYYELLFDDYRRVVAVRELYPRENDPDRGLRSVDDFVIVRHVSIFDSPFGMSDLRAADQAYCILDAVRRLRVIYLDKYTGPFVTGKYTDKAIKAELLSDLQQMRAGGVAVVPNTVDIEIVDMASGSDDAFHQAEADLKEEIVTSIAFAFLQHIGGQVPGGAGRTSEHQATARLPKWYLTRLVCGAIDTQISPQFVDFNFAGRPAIPEGKIEGTDPAALKADLEVAQLKLDMGGEISKKELDKRSGWGPARDDDDRLVKAAPVFDPYGDAGGDGADGLPPGVRDRVKPSRNGAE